MGYAAERGVENGRKVRIDATVTEADIHHPSDSSLLWDAVRVLTRLLAEAHESHGVHRYPKRTRRAKRRALDVLNAKGARKQRKAYRDLLAVTNETIGYARAAGSSLESQPGSLEARALAAELHHYVVLAEAVIDQTERRILHGEEVPASEKVALDLRGPYRHRCQGQAGDPLRAQGHSHRRPLRSHPGLGRGGREPGRFDAGDPHARASEEDPWPASTPGRFRRGLRLESEPDRGQALGITDVSFSKKRGLEVLDMVKSHWVYKRLRNFRAGIESWISFLKRSFGLQRCTWKGWAGFTRYVGASIVAANLLTLARHL